jgi:hypothetical protein
LGRETPPQTNSSFKEGGKVLSHVTTALLRDLPLPVMK